MKRVSLFITELLLFLSFLSAEQISWTAKNNFLSGIYKTENAELVSEDGKPLYYKIKKQSFTCKDANEDIDLFLPFDANDLSKNKMENYEILQRNFQHREANPHIGTSAFFYKNEHKIELQGNENSIFSPGRVIGSFTVNFYIYPMNLADNSILFRIGSHYYNSSDDSIRDQSFSAVLDEGIFKCKFRNLFYLTKDTPLPEFTVEAYQRILPQEWTNLTITYDAFSGILRLFINGLESGAAKAADQSVYPMFFNPANRCILDIGTSYVGAIDDFLILHGAETKEIEHGFPAEGATIISTVKKLDDFNVILKDTEFTDYLQDGTEIEYFARFSSTSFDADETSVSTKPINWIPLNKESIAANLYNKKVSYFQWKAQLLPGFSGKTTPHFCGLSLKYEKDLPPAAPASVKIEQKNGTLLLKWKNNTEIDLKGYKIYYGTKSGVYFGTEAEEGLSPVIIGKTNSFKLTNLKKNLIYYVSITAYDDALAEHESPFSEEVYKRVY